MEMTAKTMPSVFFATAARVLPKDVAITLEQTYPGGLDASDIAILRAIKDSIPDADARSPQEVLEYVRDTLRAAEAKPIEGTGTVQRIAREMSDRPFDGASAPAEGAVASG